MKKDRSQQPKVRAQLVVTLLEDGNFNVNGPLHDRVLCYGLLGLAQDALSKHHAQQRAQVAAAEQVKGSKPWWRRILKGAGEDLLAKRQAPSVEPASKPEEQSKPQAVH